MSSGLYNRVFGPVITVLVTTAWFECFGNVHNDRRSRSMGLLGEPGDEQDRGQRSIRGNMERYDRHFAEC